MNVGVVRRNMKINIYDHAVRTRDYEEVNTMRISQQQLGNNDEEYEYVYILYEYVEAVWTIVSTSLDLLSLLLIKVEKLTIAYSFIYD